MQFDTVIRMSQLEPLDTRDPRCAELFNWLSKMLASQDMPDFSVMNKCGWVVVPIDAHGYVTDPKVAASIQEVLDCTPEGVAFGVITGTVEPTYCCYLRNGSEDVARFLCGFGLLHVYCRAIVMPDFSGLVAIGSEDYGIVAGPAALVDEMTGMSAAESFRTFAEIAFEEPSDEFGLDVPLRQIYVECLHHYQSVMHNGFK